jgi:hypothetical protein
MDLRFHPSIDQPISWTKEQSYEDAERWFVALKLGYVWVKCDRRRTSMIMWMSRRRSRTNESYLGVTPSLVQPRHLSYTTILTTKLTNILPTTYQQHTNNIPTTYQQHTNNIPTTYQQHTRSFLPDARNRQESFRNPGATIKTRTRSTHRR